MVQSENTALQNFNYSVTRDYNPLPSLFGPINTGATRTSTASRSIDLSTPVFTQADYDRKYGITAGPSLGSNNLLNNNIFGTPTAKPGTTVVVPNYLRDQGQPRSVSNPDYFYELEALDRQKADRALDARLRSTPEPGFNTVTDQSRLIDLQYKVSSGAIMTPQERHDYDKLSLANAGRFERLEIAVGALAGFTGGYIPKGKGTLNVYEPLPQVRTQQAPIRNRGNGGRGGGIEHARVQENITRFAGGQQEVRIYENGPGTPYRVVDNIDTQGRYHQVGGMRYRGARFSPSARQRGAIEDLRQALGSDAVIIFHDKLEYGPTLINPDLQPNWRPAPSQHRNFGTQQ